MSKMPHQLADDFPALADRIVSLKQSDAHFAKLLSEYNELNEQVYGAENGLAPMEELAEADLRKKRMALKDELYRLLTVSA